MICGKCYVDFRYLLQPQQIIANYAPKPLDPACKHCVYKEKFGTKNYRKKMKEGVLDG